MRIAPLLWKILNPAAEIPQYMSEGASGFDFKACTPEGPIIIQPGETVKVPTGLAVEIIKGLEIQIRPRSGISQKTKLRLPNAPGTIDCDYRGEIGILVENTSVMGVAMIHHGERIAQGILAPVFRAEHHIVEELSETERGTGGFGSTSHETGTAQPE